MALVQNLQKLAARLNQLPTTFGVETYREVLIRYSHNGLDLTVPLSPNPSVELVKPQSVGRFLTASVEIFTGDIVLSEIARYQPLVAPLDPAHVLSKAKYLLNGKVYFCTHLDTSDTVFYTAYIREDRVTR